MPGGEAAHPGEEGGLGVEEEQGVAAPAAQQGGDQEPGCAAGRRVCGEQRHQEGLGDGVPDVPAGGQGDEVDDGREGERSGEQASHAATVSSAGSATGAGFHPGPRNTRPARSRQLCAALMSLTIETYSWVATLIGLNVSMFLVNP